ncbi:YbhB/YbcL family Raf kinase inhibitor-like protein [Waddlia chondrophila]|uniref:PEBP family protein n=1 Tax=Waddlia chondrophila (strain ATCC VR-1470 / WSU 86-1044) TaxID=716544 RepID=D6YWB0_WADCW|nr:YbhB/YbcL family Raf kinase inhibitor-like protein [Waddlia chondrophila]ADI38421.1 PEBP family protein [Waddlia chondrophila WSU 86-1044]
MNRLKITSPAFENEAPIPKKYTGEGENLSPQLNIEGTPIHVLSLAIIVDDPDAPLGDFVHWVAWNLDPDLKTIKEGIKPENEGLNDFGDIGYKGPYPPKGRRHRYFFKIFALDKILTLPQKALKADLQKAMEGHILAQGELIGTYERILT